MMNNKLYDIEKVMEGLKLRKQQLEEQLKGEFATIEELDMVLFDIRVIDRKLATLEDTLDIIFEYEWIND